VGKGVAPPPPFWSDQKTKIENNRERERERDFSKTGMLGESRGWIGGLHPPPPFGLIKKTEKNQENKRERERERERERSASCRDLVRDNEVVMDFAKFCCTQKKMVYSTCMK
jgi:hypothetical protein